jgi:hypothetical protein
VTRYASNTAISRSRSIEEIERTLSRYGADSFGYGWEGDRAVVAFRAHGRMIRDGRSVGEMALPEVARAYEKGQAPRFLLPALSPGKGKDDGT